MNIDDEGVYKAWVGTPRTYTRKFMLEPLQCRFHRLRGLVKAELDRWLVILLCCLRCCAFALALAFGLLCICSDLDGLWL